MRCAVVDENLEPGRQAEADCSDSSSILLCKLRKKLLELLMLTMSPKKEIRTLSINPLLVFPGKTFNPEAG